MPVFPRRQPRGRWAEKGRCFALPGNADVDVVDGYGSVEVLHARTSVRKLGECEGREPRALGRRGAWSRVLIAV